MWTSFSFWQRSCQRRGEAAEGAVKVKTDLKEALRKLQVAPEAKQIPANVRM